MPDITVSLLLLKKLQVNKLSYVGGSALQCFHLVSFSCSCDRTEFGMEYLPMLHNRLTHPLIEQVHVHVHRVLKVLLLGVYMYTVQGSEGVTIGYACTCTQGSEGVTIGCV